MGSTDKVLPGTVVFVASAATTDPDIEPAEVAAAEAGTEDAPLTLTDETTDVGMEDVEVGTEDEEVEMDDEEVEMDGEEVGTDNEEVATELEMDDEDIDEDIEMDDEELDEEIEMDDEEVATGAREVGTSDEDEDVGMDVCTTGAIEVDDEELRTGGGGEVETRTKDVVIGDDEVCIDDEDVTTGFDGGTVLEDSAVTELETSGTVERVHFFTSCNPPPEIGLRIMIQVCLTTPVGEVIN